MRYLQVNLSTTMEKIPLVQCYKDAVTCLEEVAAECQKSEAIRLDLMLFKCEDCARLLDELQLIDKNQHRINSLKHLRKSVNYFQEAISSRLATGQGKPENDTRGSSQHRDDSISDNTTGNSNPDRKLAIQDTIIQKGCLKFDDVAGLLEAKQALKEAIILPVQYPQLFTGGRKPWRRILLYGPPGTGKSRLAQAVSSEIDSTFYCVSSSDLVSSWVGESEKLIKELFMHATAQPGRSVIFIDEIDSICRKRSSREEEHTRRIKTELLKQMEGADNSDKQDRIFLLCATNCPWEIDSAFLRRFQKRIHIPLPDRDSRVALIRIHCQDNEVIMSEEDWQLLGERTEGCSGSDIANMVLEALFQPIREMQTATHWKHTQANKFTPCATSNEPGAFRTSMSELAPDEVEPRDLIVDDFLKSLGSHRHTVTDEELRKFQEFTHHFGQNG